MCRLFTTDASDDVFEVGLKKCGWWANEDTPNMYFYSPPADKEMDWIFNRPLMKYPGGQTRIIRTRPKSDHLNVNNRMGKIFDFSF